MNEDEKLLAFFAANAEYDDLKDHQIFMCRKYENNPGHLYDKVVGPLVEMSEAEYRRKESDYRLESFKYSRPALRMFYALDMMKKFNEMKILLNGQNN